MQGEDATHQELMHFRDKCTPRRQLKAVYMEPIL